MTSAFNSAPLFYGLAVILWFVLSLFGLGRASCCLHRTLKIPQQFSFDPPVPYLSCEMHPLIGCEGQDRTSITPSILVPDFHNQAPEVAVHSEFQISKVPR